MEGINYEIPIDNTYDAMVRDFSQQDEHISQNIQLAARCLAFYNQAIRLSTDFVLDSNLGPQIIQCMKANHATDARVAWAYSLIAKKKQINKNCLLQWENHDFNVFSSSINLSSFLFEISNSLHNERWKDIVQQWKINIRQSLLLSSQVNLFRCLRMESLQSSYWR